MDDADEEDLSDLEDIDIDDPEADAIVNDALNLDEAAETEAAAEVLNDSIAEEVAERAAAEADDVEPYDGPDVNGDPDAPVFEDGFVGDDEDEDPYEAFRGELRALPGKWYVIHSYAGFERKVKANIEQRKSTLEVEEEIYQIEVPMEDVVEIKNGQRKMVTRVRIPGYVLVRMELNEDTWSVVRHTPGVTGFVGNAHNPTPLRFEEAFNMLKSLVEIKETAPAKAGAAKKGQATTAARHPRRGRLRGRRDDHDQGGLVRGSSRHDQRDQARERQAHGPRLALRARDPGRALVRPGHEVVASRSSAKQRSRGCRSPSREPLHRKCSECCGRTRSSPEHAGLAGECEGHGIRSNERKEQWHLRRG